MQPARRIVATIAAGQCSACGVCVDECPEQAISIAELAEVDAERCIGCGACVPACPNEALSLGYASVKAGTAG